MSPSSILKKSSSPKKSQEFRYKKFKVHNCSVKTCKTQNNIYGPTPTKTILKYKIKSRRDVILVLHPILIPTKLLFSICMYKTINSLVTVVKLYHDCISITSIIIFFSFKTNQVHVNTDVLFFLGHSPYLC